MSLINKMLKDLEARQSAPSGDQSPEHLYRGLRPVRRRRRPYRALALSVGVILAVTATTTLLFANGHWDSSLLPTKIAQWAGTAEQDASPMNVVQAKQEDTQPAKTVTTRVEELQTVSVEDTSVTQESLPKQEIKPAKVEAKAMTKEKPEIEAKAATKAKTKTTTKTAAQKKKPKKELTPKKVVLEEKERPAEIQSKVMVASAKPSMAGSSLNAVSEGEVSERAAVERKLRTLTPADQAEEAYREGVQSLERNRVDEAQEKLRFAVAADPQHVEARELLAGLLMQRGAVVEAESLLKDGLATNLEHYRFAQLLARIHIQRGASDKALALLEKALPYANTDAEFFGFLAALYQRTGQHENAIKAYSRAVTINPQQSQWWLGMGISLEAKSNWRAAHQAYRRAVAGRGLSDKLGRYARQRLASVARKVSSN